jgi:small subunit ribosomal protein S21
VGNQFLTLFFNGASKLTNDEIPYAHLRGLSVTVRNNDVNGALRVLKKKIQADGIMRDLSEREHYTKPSMKRRLNKIQAIRRWKKKQQETAEQL